MKCVPLEGIEKLHSEKLSVNFYKVLSVSTPQFIFFNYFLVLTNLPSYD